MELRPDGPGPGDAPGHPRALHPHGVRYTKDSEGAHDRAQGAGGLVPPGGRFTYTWIADEESGPGPGELSSKVWWYHSHVDEPADVNAGLLGPLIVTARGRARADGAPADVDREFVALMMVIDEAQGEEPSTGTPGLCRRRAAAPGTWMLHCHVADHFRAGMYATFTIQP